MPIPANLFVEQGSFGLGLLQIKFDKKNKVFIEKITSKIGISLLLSNVIESNKLDLQAKGFME